MKIPDTIISIIKTESSGIEPLYGKMYIRKVRYMKDDYPQIVCLECLNEAWEDTKKFDNKVGEWSGAYSVYGAYCEVCEQDKDECTEPRDAGYPNFDYVKQRIRAKKINKIIDKI